MLCRVCAGSTFTQYVALWDRLVTDWQLSPEEVQYINEQQGLFCDTCDSSFRSQALALALQTYFGSDQTLVDLVKSELVAEVKILEMNEAGTLTRHLSLMPGHVFAAYPEVDLQALPYDDCSFDLVVHSDTLEHVPQPVRAIAECYRVLRPGGALCFTVPIIVGRLGRNRGGLAPSYHGDPSSSDLVVHTEYGADVWLDVLRAGFQRVEFVCLKLPSALALIARK